MKLRPISFNKNALLELRSTHDTLQSTTFTPCSASSCSFVYALNSWTQNCRKSQILRLSKVSRLKHEFQASYVIMVIMVNCIPQINFV